MINGKELIPLSNTPEIVKTYNEALRDLETAFSLIGNVKVKLLNTLGKYRDNIFDGHRLSDFDFDGKGPIELSKRVIKLNTWRFIADKSGLKTLLSIKRAEEFDRQLTLEQVKDLPEVTEANIFAFLQGNLEKAGDLVQEAIQEVFDILRPNKQYHDFKTNSEYEIGRKVFFEWMMDTNFFVRVMSSSDKKLNAIDKLFHLMDGKGVPKYPDTLVTQIDEACRAKKWEAETEYFKLKWYKKGSLHMEFKRMDLVNEINKRAGGNRLNKPPDKKEN